jgi:phosphate starvation-inducible PhoH-like protein
LLFHSVVVILSSIYFFPSLTISTDFKLEGRASLLLKRAISIRLKLQEGIDTATLFGQYDIYLKKLEAAFKVKILARGEEVILEGEDQPVKQVERILNDLSTLVGQGVSLQENDVDLAIRVSQEHPSTSIRDSFQTIIPVSPKRRPVAPKTPTQRRYVEAIQAHGIVIGIGPAGTGKTYLAMAMAISALLRKEVSRIILARPAVEAGERLGFLPGDMYEKVNPYLRPLYDALYDMMEVDQANRLVEKSEIEIAPLAFMRGRTLNDSFIILDEAQNATAEQMKMFLTRLGYNSKTVVTGDITQVDLPEEKRSGLIEIQEILSGIEGIRFIYFSDQDVVRHKLVQEIIKAYEKHSGKIGKGKRRPGE